MKKLLNIIMLITALLFVSCKEESGVSRIGKSTKKSVKVLSYSFNSQKEDVAKSGSNIDSTNKIENKVISIERWEEGGEFFTVSLIEERDLIETKAGTTQDVNASSVYTFYAYKDSEIKLQSPITGGSTVEVPVDEKTNYGMLFLSSADGMNKPKEVTIPTTAINKTNKEITYNAKFNENLCYAIFDRETMPTTNPIDVTFKPVFAQLGVSVPKTLAGKTASVNGIRLLSGSQQTATVKIKYNSNPTSNISYSYEKTDNYQVDLNYGLNATNDTTILQVEGGRYYNIIPNGKDAAVEIKLTSSTGDNVTKTITLKDKNSQPIKFSEGKRYKLLVNDKSLDGLRIELSPNRTELDLLDDRIYYKVIAVYSNGDEKVLPNGLGSGVSWSYDNSIISLYNVDGYITGKATGIAYFEASYTEGSKTVTARRYIQVLAPTIKVTPDGKTIDVGDYLQMTAKAYGKYTNTYGKDITRDYNCSWSSSSSSYASVDRYGEVTGRKAGSARIFAEYKGSRGSAAVYVNDPPKLEVTPGSTTLVFGLTQQLKAEYVYNGTRRDVTSNCSWSANNSASVTRGKVTITKEGTTTITANYSNVSGTATVKPQIWRRYSRSDYIRLNVSYGTVSLEQAKIYLGAGVYYSKDDGYIFLLPDGKLYCCGLWLKRSPGNATPPQTRVTPLGHYRPTNYGSYYFVPNCGGYYPHAPNYLDGTNTFLSHWLSTPAGNNRWCIAWKSNIAFVYENGDVWNVPLSLR